MNANKELTTLKQSYEVTISLLTPLHIGSGKELLRDYDYVTQNGRTWVINADALLARHQKADGSFDMALLGKPAADLLQPKDFRLDSDSFRYILPGQPRAQGHGAVLREQYKDAFDKPYLPGSSIKGALRTVLAWHGFQEDNMQLKVESLSANARWVGQSLEREIFGKSPNFDLLRGLHVADSQPQSRDRLQIINAQVVTGGDEFGSPIELEAVRSDTVFTATISLDQSMHTQAAESILHFGAKWSWLERLPEIARAYVKERIEIEHAWFLKHKYDAVAAFYGQLEAVLSNNSLTGHTFLLQIGWGGGWRGKTIGEPLQQDRAQWEALLSNRKLSPARFDRRHGDDFPKSRRAVVANQRVVAPLGWCLVEMTEKTTR